MKKIFLITILFSLAVASCKKELDVRNPNSPTVQSAATESGWLSPERRQHQPGAGPAEGEEERGMAMSINVRSRVREWWASVKRTRRDGQRRPSCQYLGLTP